jgi:hypothetical protein
MSSQTISSSLSLNKGKQNDQKSPTTSQSRPATLLGYLCNSLEKKENQLPTPTQPPA